MIRKIEEYAMNVWPASLGVVILYNVVEQQLHGTIRYESDGGLRWFISFDDSGFVERV